MQRGPMVSDKYFKVKHGPNDVRVWLSNDWSLNFRFLSDVAPHGDFFGDDVAENQCHNFVDAEN